MKVLNLLLLVTSISKSRCLFFLLALLVFSCQPEDGVDGVNGINGIDGVDGTDGYNSLIVVLDDTNSVCPNGGIIVHSGLDLNRDNLLNVSEYTSTQYVCNGQDGQDGEDGEDATSNFMLTTNVSEEATYSCGTNSDGNPIGGVEMVYGYDLNSNGSLDGDEILSTVIICNGENGIDGNNALVSIDTIEIGEICTYGGMTVSYGLDINLNGVLDAGEIEGSDIACFSGLGIPSYGDYREGGIVFYIAPEPTDLDGDGDLDTGLVCSIEDLVMIRWHNGVDVVTEATDEAIGYGAVNTDKIIMVQGEEIDSYAAGGARLYDGENNWFLPSKDELNLMFINKSTLSIASINNGGFAFTDDFYWTSTEHGEGTVLAQHFGVGTQGAYFKNWTAYVRAVRAF